MEFSELMSFVVSEGGMLDLTNEPRLEGTLGQLPPTTYAHALKARPTVKLHQTAHGLVQLLSKCAQGWSFPQNLFGSLFNTLPSTLQKKKKFLHLFKVPLAATSDLVLICMLLYTLSCTFALKSLQYKSQPILLNEMG